MERVPGVAEPATSWSREGAGRSGPGRQGGSFNGRRVSERAASARCATGAGEHEQAGIARVADRRGRSLRSRLVSVILTAVRKLLPFAGSHGAEAGVSPRRLPDQAGETRRLREMPASAGSPSPDMRERLAGATAGSTGAEVDWDSFARPPQSSSDLHKALIEANRQCELRLLQQAGEQIPDTVDRNDRQASSGVAQGTLRTQGLTTPGNAAGSVEFDDLLDRECKLRLLQQKAGEQIPDTVDRNDRQASPGDAQSTLRTWGLTSLRNAAGTVVLDDLRDRETVELLKRFYLGTLDAAGMRRMAGNLHKNRVLAASMERLADTMKQKSQVLNKLFEEGGDASRVGWRLARALRVRFKERVEELWQLHLLGAWVGVQSERDYLFRSPWMDTSNRASPSRENQQPKPGTPSGISDQASGSDGETSPESVDGVRDAEMRDTSSLESATSQVAQPMGSVSSGDGSPAPLEAISETTVRASPPADTGGGAVSSDESQDSQEPPIGFTEFDIALYRALKLLSKSRHEVLDAAEVVELFEIVGPGHQRVLSGDLVKLRASFEDFRAVRWQIARSEQLFDQLEGHTLPASEVDRLGRLIDANREMAAHVLRETIPDLQSFRHRQPVGLVATKVAERMAGRLAESIKDMYALHLQALDNNVPTRFSQRHFENWLDLQVEGGQGEMRPERPD